MSSSSNLRAQISGDGAAYVHPRPLRAPAPRSNNEKCSKEDTGHQHPTRTWLPTNTPCLPFAVTRVNPPQTKKYTPAKWQPRMVIAAEHDRSPHRMMDRGPLNLHGPRQTRTVNTWHLATLIQDNKCQTARDNGHGYHNLPPASKEDKVPTTFITPRGCYRYQTVPQGPRLSGDGSTDRMNKLFSDV